MVLSDNDLPDGTDLLRCLMDLVDYLQPGTQMSFKPQVRRGPVQDEVTLYALNKATYDLIHNVQDSGRPLLVTRENKKLVMIVPMLPREKAEE